MAANPIVVTHAAQPQPLSLLAKFAGRYSVEPTKMMSTLKSTAFKVKDGEVSNEQLMALLVVADQYGLNPFTKEIYAFPDKGGIVPVVGVDGWLRIINSHPEFDGMDFVDGPGDKSGLPEWIECVIYRKDRSHPTKVREYMVECRRGTPPWQSHPRRMLRHKATIQCSRLAFGFSGIYDLDEAERIRDARDITPREPQAVAALNARIAATSAVIDDATPARPPAPTFLAVSEMLLHASSREVLSEVRNLVPSVEDADDRQELLAMIAVREDELQLDAAA